MENDMRFNWVCEGDLYTSDWKDRWRAEWRNKEGASSLVLVNQRTGTTIGEDGERINLALFEKLWR